MNEPERNRPLLEKLLGGVASFVAGALIGFVIILLTYWVKSLPILWGAVGLGSIAMGIVAVVFGKTFWNVIFNVLP